MEETFDSSLVIMTHLFVAILQDISEYFRSGSALPESLQIWAKKENLEDLKLGTLELLSLSQGKNIKCTSLLSKAVAKMICKELTTPDDLPKGNIADYVYWLKKTYTLRSQETILIRALNQLEPHAPLIIVEAPMTLTEKQKSMFRHDISTKEEYAFVRFRTNSELIGGIRVYHNGILSEHSLRSELDTIFSNLYLNV